MRFGRSMRMVILFIGLVFTAISLAPLANALDKKETFTAAAVDNRHEAWKNKRWKTSDKKIRWRMTEIWPAGFLLHKWAQHWVDSVSAASGGRLEIQLLPAGALVPANEVFDAVSQGTVQCAHSVAGMWKGKNEGFVGFWSIPYGLDAEGFNIWLYERGGLKMWQEAYTPFNLVVFPCGNAGQEMGFFSNKKAEKLSDYKGMKVRTMGYYSDILTRLGVSVSPLPGGEIYLSLERGVVDAAEFSSPALNVPIGFHEITKYAITPGIHQPGTQTELIINRDAWSKLPEDLKVIVEICAKETQLWATTWNEALNAMAMEFYKDNIEIVSMDDETIVEFAKVAYQFIEERKQKNELLKKVLDSQEAFRKEFSAWRKARGRLAPWPYDDFVSGQLQQ